MQRRMLIYVCMTNMPARQQTLAEQQGNYAVIRPFEKETLTKAFSRASTMFNLIIPVFLACLAWNVEEASRGGAFQTKLRLVSSTAKKGQKGLACWYWWSMLCATRLKSRSISSTEPLKIRPHRFGGEGVLIGVQTATLNAQSHL